MNAKTLFPDPKLRALVKRALDWSKGDVVLVHDGEEIIYHNDPSGLALGEMRKFLHRSNYYGTLDNQGGRK